MVYVTAGPDSCPFFKHSAYALPLICTRFPFIHAVLHDRLEFTPDSLCLDQRSLLASHRHMAAGQYYQTQPAT